MITSNVRKLCLNGWLQVHAPNIYCSPIRLQSFLFFYEAFSKVEGDTSDFSNLRGHKMGPVFTTVWNDHVKEGDKFDDGSLLAYAANRHVVNELRAERTRFLVLSLSENELCSISREFHIWRKMKPFIATGFIKIDLDENDFDCHDMALINELKSICTDELIRDSTILSIDETNFVFSKDDYRNLTTQHLDTLMQLSRKGELYNPVFAEIDEDGILCVI